MPGLRTLVISFVVAAVLATSSSFFASERYRRDWSDHPGMPRTIYDIEYDDRGFLWLASEEGIHRFDGQEVVPWSSDDVYDVRGINRGPEGQLFGFSAQGVGYEVTAEGVSVLDHAGGTPLTRIHDADYAADGGLWVCDNAGLFHRNPQGDWTAIKAPELEGQIPIRVRGAPDGGAFVGTGQGSFIRVHPDHTAVTWMSDPTGQVTRIAVKDADTQAFGLRYGPNNGIYFVEHGEVRPIYRASEVGRRWTGMVFRDETLWVAASNEVLAVTDNGRHIEILGPEHGFYGGGEAIVDHEKSLWLMSFRGTYQFTEPDVVLETEMDGTREVHHLGTDIVIGRWRGPYRLDKNGDWQPMTPDGYMIFDWGGVSPWGTTWFVGVQYANTPQRRSALLEIDRDGWVHHLTREYGVFAGAYAIDESGVFWIAFHNTLWRVNEKGATPQPVALLAREKGDIRGLVVEQGRVRMAFRHGPYCEGLLNADRSALDGEWDCEIIEGARELLDFKLVDGVPWIGTWDRGVVRRNDDDDWETIVGEKELGTPTIRGISVSPRGGVWVMSYLGKVRVELHEEGARVVERLGPWIGVPNWMTFGAREQPDGTVWLSGMTSAIRIPPHARQRPTEPPRVFVTGFRADGRALSPDTAQTLAATTRRIDVSWAAPAFRDPASLRYQVRADSDGDWVPTRERSVQFVDLGPGDYRIEVRASLDGENWSEAAAAVRFAIRSPLWQRPTFWAAMLAVAAIGVLLIQWQRARQQVRLERQRTGIAMNLHDELGAGLGSIGLLTDLAAGDEMEPQESREVATRVGEISRGLSRSLSDIVWTLRPASVDLPGFALFLRQRASDLLSAGDATVEFDFPEPVPAIRLQLEVRRQIHTIASEALHNAAKHAQASKVRVGLQRDGDAWILRIADDGIGFGEEPGRDGLGLESMSKRADVIGASLSIQAEKDTGCRVELRFSPRAEDRT